MSNWFNIFPTSIIVDGYNKSVLLNLSGNDFIELPVLLKNLILSLQKNSIKKVARMHSIKKKEIDDFVNQLCMLKIGFKSDVQVKFRKLNHSVESPYNANTLIFSIDSLNFKMNTSILNYLNIDCLGFHIKVQFDLKELKDFITETVKLMNFNTIQIRFFVSVKKESIEEIIAIHSKITHIILENEMEDKIVFYNDKTILFLNRNYVANKTRFVINLPYYLEAKNFNYQVHKNLIFDSYGNIRFHSNSPITKFHINSITNRKELQLLYKSGIYKNSLKAKKDDIDICKHCEFRYMCVDSRLPIKRNENEWYFDSECNYNPYIAKWQNEDGYKTLEQCGITSNQTGFKINRKKLNAINKELWESDE